MNNWVYEPYLHILNPATIVPSPHRQVFGKSLSAVLGNSPSCLDLLKIQVGGVVVFLSSNGERPSLWLEVLGFIPEGRPGNPLQFLAWRIAWTEEPGGLQPTGSQRARHGCSDAAHVKHGCSDAAHVKHG